MADAFAQSSGSCAFTEKVSTALSERSKEMPLVMGRANGVLFQWRANANEGSWSSVVARPDGINGLAATGSDNEIFARPPKDNDTQLTRHMEKPHAERIAGECLDVAAETEQAL